MKFSTNRACVNCMGSFFFRKIYKVYYGKTSILY